MQPRVALVSSSYHPYVGGVEEHTRHVARGLKAQGLSVEVWTVDRGEGLGRGYVDGILVRYIRTPLPARRVTSAARFAMNVLPAVASWLDAAREFRPDVIHVQCFGPNGLYALALTTLLRRPLVVSSHGETFADQNDVFSRSALLRRGLVSACDTAAQVTGCSEIVARDLTSRFGAADVLVVPNGVALEHEVSHVPPVSSGSSPTIVAVGRLVQVKGFDLLIRALPLIPPEVRLQLVGDGPEDSALRSLARELAVDSRVEFLGRRNAREVQEVMGRGQVVVVPSRREAFGIVALEAWATGAPLIATTLGGPAGFVSHGVDGLLVDPHDTAALAKAVRSVLEDPDLASNLSASGRTSVRRFTWDRVVSDYQGIYDAAMRS